jgi:glutathione peroxidase
MKLAAMTGFGIRSLQNTERKKPITSFYELEATTINGENISLERYRGLFVMVVNVASKCGYTAQYAELEALSRARSTDLVVLGFPSNDFGGQEPGTDEQIAEFCRVNFWVHFPLFKKDHVRGRKRQAVYDWLADPSKNGWNYQEPGWNFCKYIISPEGILDAFYSSAVSPLSQRVSNHLI